MAPVRKTVDRNCDLGSATFRSSCLGFPTGRGAICVIRARQFLLRCIVVVSSGKNIMRVVVRGGF